MPTQNIYDLVDTWNDGATTFTAVKMTVTNTASGAASLLMDLRLGPDSKFNVDKSGIAYSSLGFGYCAGNAPAFSTQYAQLGSASNLGLGLSSSSPINWYPNTPISGAADTILTRRAAANLRLGAADAATAQPQTLSVQSVVAGTSNTAGANLTITGSQGTGTGAGGSIIFQVAPAGSTGTAQNALATALTINADRSITVAANASSLAQIAMADRGTVISAYATPFGQQPLLIAMPGGLQINNDTGGYSLGASGDVVLRRDAANTLALRNGVNAQAFRVYNTTDGTNSEYGFMKWNGTTFEIGAEKSGTGSNRSVTVRSSSGAITLTDGNSNFVLTSGAVSLGTRSLYELVNIIGQTGYSEMAEMTAPAAPAANSVRIYAVDNGSGKTQLMARFATGAAQQIAIEP